MITCPNMAHIVSKYGPSCPNMAHIIWDLQTFHHFKVDVVIFLEFDSCEKFWILVWVKEWSSWLGGTDILGPRDPWAELGAKQDTRAKYLVADPVCFWLTRSRSILKNLKTSNIAVLYHSMVQPISSLRKKLFKF